jgi:hypothetical protein
MSNKNLKIAFCYSGFMRNFKQNFIKNKDLIKKLNPDIFIYTYDSFGYKNDSSIPEPKNNMIISEDYFKEIPNLKKVVVNNFDPLKISDLEDKNIKYYMHDHHAYPKNILSQLYNIYMCNNLKKQYEKENSFNYDFVFRLRPDTYFNNFNINQFLSIKKTKTIFVCEEAGKYWGGACSLCLNKIFHFYHNNDISDIFAFGDSKSMNYYSSLFLVANNIHNDLSNQNEIFFNKYNDIKSIDNKKIINFKHLEVKNFVNKNSLNEECYLFYPESLLRFYLLNYNVIKFDSNIIINRSEVY